MKSLVRDLKTHISNCHIKNKQGFLLTLEINKSNIFLPKKIIKQNKNLEPLKIIHPIFIKTFQTSKDLEKYINTTDSNLKNFIEYISYKTFQISTTFIEFNSFTPLAIINKFIFFFKLICCGISIKYIK